MSYSNLVLLFASVLAAVVVLQAIRYARRALRTYLLRTFTGIVDLEQVGSARDGPKLNGTAVVCGGSFAGLFTARVCSDHFERVVVVEAEQYTLAEEARTPSDTTTVATRPVHDASGAYKTLAHKRSRVYQYASTHVVQVLLTRFLRAVFPDFDSRAKSAGARVGLGDLRLHLGGRLLAVPIAKYADYAHQVVFASRRTLETLVRGAVVATCPKIEFIQGTVTDFRVLDGRVHAVAFRRSDGTVGEIPCLLVADCSGSTQVGMKCLTRALPDSSIARSEYNPQLNFTSFEFPEPPNFDKDLRALGIRDSRTGKVMEDIAERAWLLLHGPDPALDYRTIFFGRTDLGRIVGGVGGWASEVPVTLDALREYMHAVIAHEPVPEYVFKILDLLEPVKDEGIAFPAKCSSCSRVFYERAADVLPSNFIAVGDAVMRLNPRSGVGVAKCALGALTLDGLLRSVTPEEKQFGHTYFQRLALRTGIVWDASRWGDYARETTTPAQGETLEDGALFRWFFSHFERVITQDEAAAEAFWLNFNLLTPPTDIATPTIVGKVLLEAARSLRLGKA